MKKMKTDNNSTEETIEKKKKETEEGGKWDSLLTLEEEKQEEEQYIQPNIEHKLPAHKRKECRDILQEIRRFGVSQRQMLYLIYLMALELEDITTMKALVKAIGEHRENIPLLSEAASSSSPGGGSKLLILDEEEGKR